MKVFQRDKDGNKILDKEGSPKTTKEYDRTFGAASTYFSIAMIALMIGMIFWHFFLSDPICPGCGKVVIEGVGINEDGVLVDGGAKYHDFGCTILEATRAMQEGVNEQARIIEKQKRLNSGE